ncbi:MAG: patatin-like phospholipase family protein [Elusimicrobia bacterium]|nr:patatin-like phospholipase family protein [Elusimicrobiota bacterium]
MPSTKEMAMDLLWESWRLMPQEKRGRTGVVFSGGGARAMAHIGVLRHLLEIGFPLEAIAGTSMGAMVAGVYASGANIDQIESMAEEVGFNRFMQFGTFRFVDLALSDGMAPTRRYERWMRKATQGKTFAQTRAPLIVCATDLVTGDLVLLREGELAPALIAAATIPGIFQPVSIRQHYLVDGGLLYNVPTQAIYLLDAKNVLVIDISARGRSEVMTRPPTSLGALYRSIEVIGDKLEQAIYEKGDYALRFFPTGIAFFELWRWRLAWEQGLQAARSHSAELQAAFIEKSLKELGWKFFEPQGQPAP